MLQTQNPYSRERIDALTSTLAGMNPQARQAYAAQHKDDPAVIAVALNVNNILNAADRSKAMQAGMGAKPTVVDQEIAGMAPPVAMTRLPEDQGIGALPTPNIKHMADGGIAGYDDGGMADGGSMFDFAERSEPVLRMAEGGMKKLSGADLFEAALQMEGVTDPAEVAFLKSIHGQESGGKASSKDSNRGAKGAMQVMPDTFKSVADPDMDINKPLDNMRAGIRYGRQGFTAAKGDPVLAGAYYYGGPGGMQKAAKGVAVSDPKNPNAPTTLGYGQSIAKRMTDLLPISSAQAATPAPAGTPEERQAASDREAMMGTVKKMGAAAYDVATLLPRGAMGAFESAVTRPLNALGVPVPYLPESAYGGDRTSMTPAYDALRREETSKAGLPSIAPDNQSAAETARLQRQNAMPPPALQQKAIEVAKEEVPKDTLFGLGKEDVMMLGLQLMAGQSPYAMQNLGEAGIKTLMSKQAREKAALDKELVQAHKRYYAGAGAKAEAEAKALEDNTRGLSGLVQAYAKDPMALKMLEASDNPQDQKLAALIKMQIQQMVGAPPPTVLSAPQGKAFG